MIILCMNVAYATGRKGKVPIGWVFAERYAEYYLFLTRALATSSRLCGITITPHISYSVHEYSFDRTSAADYRKRHAIEPLFHPNCGVESATTYTLWYIESNWGLLQVYILCRVDNQEIIWTTCWCCSYWREMYGKSLHRSDKSAVQSFQSISEIPVLPTIISLLR